MITLLDQFITPLEEEQLIHNIRPLKANLSPYTRNRVTRYGSKLPYKAPTRDIPDWLFRYTLRVASTERWGGLVPDSITINEYQKGQSIDWHIDSKASGPVITVLSLGCPATMGLKGDDEEQRILLPPRSLLNMTDDDRWLKKHCIYPVEDLRCSIVFRKGTDDPDDA